MPPAPAAALPYLPTLGVQVWTVRDLLDRDVAGTLRAIADAGYAQVELMRTLDAATFVPHVRALGLGLTSAFVDWQAIATGDTAPQDAHLAVARELGLRYLVFGYLPKGERETVAQMRRHAATLTAFGRRCREAGVQLCYHHHAFEFAPLEDGRTTGWDIVLHETDPDLVKIELDAFWCAIAGRDPVRLLLELRGRVPQVHLKDLAPGLPVIHDEAAVPPDAFREVGSGRVDFPAFLAACVATGVHQCHVEQDMSPDPLASLRTSLAWLRRG